MMCASVVETTLLETLVFGIAGTARGAVHVVTEAEAYS